MGTSDLHPNGVPSTQPHPGTTAPTSSNDPDAIREDIERTRANLAGTVDALHAKLDVKTQAKARVARAKDQATTESGRPRPEVLAGAAGALLLVAALVWWRRG
jgi:Protein of unknown function (DUF3618)